MKNGPSKVEVQVQVNVVTFVVSDTRRDILNKMEKINHLKILPDLLVYM